MLGEVACAQNGFYWKLMFALISGGTLIRQKCRGQSPVLKAARWELGWGGVGVETSLIF